MVWLSKNDDFQVVLPEPREVLQYHQLVMDQDGKLPMLQNCYIPQKDHLR